MHLIHQLSDSQIADLHQLYQTTWWSKGRELADIRRMLAHSDHLFGLCEPTTERLVAFARVLSDSVYRALIFDVIVDEAFRGQGLGRQLMDAVVSDPALQGLERLSLICTPEMVPFYEQWGFSCGELDLRLMRRLMSPQSAGLAAVGQSKRPE